MSDLDASRGRSLDGKTASPPRETTYAAASHTLSAPRSSSPPPGAAIHRLACNICAPHAITLFPRRQRPISSSTVFPAKNHTGAIIPPSHTQVAPPAMEVNKPCGHCGKPEGKQRCSRCKVVYYCGRECQQADWKEHKKTCGAAPAPPAPPPPPPPPPVWRPFALVAKIEAEASATTASRSRAPASTTSATRASSTRRYSACSTRRWCGRTSRRRCAAVSSPAAPTASSKPSRPSTRRRRGRRSRRARS